MKVAIDDYVFELDACQPQEKWDDANHCYSDVQLLSDDGIPLYKLKVSAYEKALGIAAKPETFMLGYVPLEQEPEVERHAQITFESLTVYTNRNSGKAVYKAEGVQL